MKNNHMRVMLCLLMCCVLLFTCVARPASATSVAVVAGLAAIPVAVAVACAFQALGVMSGSNSTDFTTSVDNCSNWLTENSSFVVNGAVSLLGLTNAGVTTSYLQKSFVQDVWEWLFTSQTVVEESIPGSGASVAANVRIPVIDGQYALCNVPCDIVKYVGYSSDPANNYFWINWGVACIFRDEWGVNEVLNLYDADGAILKYSNSPSQITYGDKTLSFLIVSGGSNFKKTATADATSYLSRLSGFVNIGLQWKSSSAANVLTVLSSGLTADKEIISIDNISLGQIQSPYHDVGTEEETIQIEIAPIYIDWTKYGVPDPNNPETPPEDDPAYRHWLPTGIPSPEYDDSVIKQNQQQAQSGVVSGDITFEPYEPDDPGSGGGGGAGTGTDLSTVIQTIINVPSAIVTGIGNFISDFFGFNGNHEGYIVQLRDFFPFCIPFDLYDFITVLSSEPEAPVFHWEIPVPQLGQTFELEVDLSAWDDIAVLFRNLELLAFIFGLAVMTREKFLRS